MSNVVQSCALLTFVRELDSAKNREELGKQ